MPTAYAGRLTAPGIVCRPPDDSAGLVCWLAHSGDDRPSALAEAKAAARGRVVPVLLHGNRWSVALTSAERAMRGAAVAELDAAIRIAGQLGSQLVVTSLPPRDAMTCGLEALRRAIPKAGAVGVRLALEGAGARELAATAGVGWCAAAGEAGGPGCLAAFSTARLLPGTGAASVLLLPADADGSWPTA